MNSSDVPVVKATGPRDVSSSPTHGKSRFLKKKDDMQRIDRSGSKNFTGTLSLKSNLMTFTIFFIEGSKL